MAEYGITKFGDGNKLYIRQPHCRTNLRVRKKIQEYTHYETFWVVEVTNGDNHPQEIYIFGDEESALNACDRLAYFIDAEAAQPMKQGDNNE